MSKFAAIQMASGPNVTANLSEAERLLVDARKNGAELIVLPENFAHMGIHDQDILDVAEDISQPGQILDFLVSQAQQQQVWLLGGTIPLRAENPAKVYAASLLFNPSGEIVARYDKIHLFDVDLSEERGAYQESAFTQAGKQIVVADSPFGRLGIAVCYDIRFPEMFRRMTRDGMDILLLPSAFTSITGNAHWEVLNRSRAIENLCYVVASAQGGYHVNGRETHGDSMIVSPWGKIIDHLPRGSGYVIADIDKGYLQETRHNFPALEHRRFFCQMFEIK